MKTKWLSKKVASLMIAGSMIFSLVACGNEVENISKEQTGAIESTQKQQETPVTATEVGSVEITYPLQTDVEVSIWCGAQIAYCDEYSSWEESPFHTGLADKTGVTVDWRWISAGATEADAYNLLLLDEELPTIIYRSISANDATELLEDGIIHELTTELLETYAPNFWAYINDPANAAEKQAITTNDGAFYGLPLMRESDYNLTWIGPMVRQDWLDECGLSTPVTLEDWENMLIAFKEKYDCAPLAFRWAYPAQSGGIASGTGALGWATGMALRVRDGKVIVPQMEEAWVEELEVLHRWYENGLLDADAISMDNNAVRNKALENKLGVTIVPMSQATNLINDAKNANSDANWVGLEYPRTEAGAATSMIMTEAQRASVGTAVITSSATEEQLKVALQWLDYAYSEDGMMYWNFGEEGVSYQLNANGEPEFTDAIKNDPQGIDYASRRYSGQAGGAFGIQMASLVAAKNDPTVAAAVYKWIENTEASEHYMPGVTLTAEENEISSQYLTALMTYVDEEGMKFVTGDRDISTYDEFLKTMYTMGLQEVLDVWQAAYDRYMGN